MPTPTYTPLATVTLGSSAASVTFSSIPATYRDLIVVYSGTLSTGGPSGIEFYFNADETAANYSYVWAYGDSGGAASASGTNQFFIGSSGQSTSILQIMDYSATNKHKTTLTRSNSAATEVDMLASRWANTAAITSIVFKDSSAVFNFASGCTFSLYGVIA
jgi:hypothetical protein